MRYGAVSEDQQAVEERKGGLRPVPDQVQLHPQRPADTGFLPQQLYERQAAVRATRQTRPWQANYAMRAGTRAQPFRPGDPDGARFLRSSLWPTLTRGTAYCGLLCTAGDAYCWWLGKRRAFGSRPRRPSGICSGSEPHCRTSRHARPQPTPFTGEPLTVTAGTASAVLLTAAPDAMVWCWRPGTPLRCIQGRIIALLTPSRAVTARDRHGRVAAGRACAGRAVYPSRDRGFGRPGVR